MADPLAPLAIAGVASLGPTLMGLAAFLQARGANRAVNHAMPGEQTLAQNVVQMREDVIEVRGDLVGVREDITEVRGRQEQTLALAANAVVGIDALKDRAADIESAVAEAASVANQVKHDLGQFNEIDTLGREGRIQRRTDDPPSDP